MTRYTQSVALHLSVVVISYQRCELLIRLLKSLKDALLKVDGFSIHEVEVVVILDGSTDGSEAAVANFEMPCRLRYVHQENAGRAAARNAGAEMAAGNFCWFLDDDMTVSEEALATHFHCHKAASTACVLVGPQWEQEVGEASATYFNARIERLAAAKTIKDAFDFWSGNFSMPRRIFMIVGKFDADFVGWGAEDVEFGFHLLRYQIPIIFRSAAGGKHWRPRTLSSQIHERREEGRNLVRLCELHPEAMQREYITDAAVRSVFTYVRPAWVYDAMARGVAFLLRFNAVAGFLGGFALFDKAMAAARLAGILYANPPDELKQRLVYGGELMESGEGTTVRALLPNAGTGLEPVNAVRREYEVEGMIKSCGTLADQDAIPVAIADAALFHDAVAELKAGNKRRVPYMFTPAIARVACDPALTKAIENILGTEAWVSWGANIQSGTPNAAHNWHRDLESLFWPSITVAVGLCGCAEKNATLYIPGSHCNPHGPDATEDPTNTERVLQAAKKANPVCTRIERFDHFNDGNFFIFNARGWHCGDISASTNRLVLFLHYQRADEPRIPYMRDYTENSWFDSAAAFMPNPLWFGQCEHAVYSAPTRWS